MDATKAKSLLSDVPKEQFLTDKFTNYADKCCGVGHLCRLTSDDPNDYSTRNCADMMFGGLLNEGKEEVFKFVRETTHNFLSNVKELDVKGVAQQVSSAYHAGSIPENPTITLAEVNNHDVVNGYTQDHPKDRVMSLLDEMIEAGY